MFILILGEVLFLSSLTIGTIQLTSSSTAINANNTITISIPSAIEDLNPLFSNSYYDLYAYAPIYQSLYAIYNTTNNLYNGQVVPIIAGSYSVASNGTTWTFNIRPNQIWSDGIPLNASDILFTYQILMNKFIDINYYTSWSSFFKDNSSNSMRVVNATQIIFNLLSDNLPANTTYTISEVFTTAIFPRHVFKPLVANPQAWQNDITDTVTGLNRTVLANGKTIQIHGPIGSGPYQYVGYNAINEVWSLTINPKFNAGVQHLKAPSIHIINIIIISDATSALTNLNSGAVQLVDYNTGLNNVYSQLNQSSIAHPVNFRSNDYQELGYNQWSPIWGMNPPNQLNLYNNITTNTATNGDLSNTPRNMTWIQQLQTTSANIGQGNVTASQWFFENLNATDRLKIRLAMDYAIPRQQIIDTILNGYGYTLATWVTPYFNVYDPDIQARPFNQTISKLLLAKVFGYTYNANATDYTNVPYFTMNFMVSSGGALRLLWQSVIQNSFLTIGINVTITYTTFNTILNRAFFNPVGLGMDYVHGGWDTLFIGGVWASLVPDFRFEVQSQYYQAAGNYYLINNSQITAISNWMLNQTGPNAVANATAFQQWYYNNIPSSMLFENQATFGVANQLHNFRPTYQQFNYNEWAFTTNTTSSPTTFFSFINNLFILGFLLLGIVILLGGIIFLRFENHRLNVFRSLVKSMKIARYFCPILTINLLIYLPRLI